MKTSYSRGVEDFDSGTMGAPKGNDYAKEFWIERSVAKPGEKSVQIGTRLSKTEVEAIKKRLQPGRFGPMPRDTRSLHFSRR